MSTGSFLATMLVAADPDPNRPVIPNWLLFGPEFNIPVAALLGATWGLFLVLATGRMFVALTNVKVARKAAMSDSLAAATKKFRVATIAVALLLSAGIITGGYITFANLVLASK